MLLLHGTRFWFPELTKGSSLQFATPDAEDTTPLRSLRETANVSMLMRERQRDNEKQRQKERKRQIETEMESDLGMRAGK